MNVGIPAMLATLAVSLALPAQAQRAEVDLSRATLEDLMAIEITSASRKEERAQDVPAAVYVVTREEIRRSGMTSLPDLLRLVPGVQVARINSNKWAVSVRGFNALYSNKLLVLMDGRSLYNPLFSTVLWDTEDVMVESIERIEVIRGPGGAVWGANAVNGVINIVTRSAGDTQGLLLRAGTDTFAPGNVAVRYGGGAGSGAYRVFAQFSSHGDSVLASRARANDHWSSLTGGFRSDWANGPDVFMVHASAAAGQERPLWVSLDPADPEPGSTTSVSETQVAHALGRWQHARPGGATLQLQSFVDLTRRQEAIFNYRRETVDLDANYHTALGRRWHDVVIGGGYRYVRESAVGGVGYAFTPDRAQTTLVNAFIQDEIALRRARLRLNLGVKIEHDTRAGAGLQPTARLMWNPTSRQRLWGAVSRALRTPSLLDYGIRVDFPPTTSPAAPIPLAVSVLGNPSAQNERLLSTEAGYRIDIGSRAAIDVAVFAGRYKGLQTSEPSAPELRLVGGQPQLFVSTIFKNLLNANTTGGEVTARVALSEAWQVDGTFSAFHLTPLIDPASQDLRARDFDGQAPTYQWRGHSGFSFGSRAQADVMLFYNGPLGQLGVPAYTRADARFELKLTPRLSVAARGQNLFSGSHVEFAGSETNVVTTRVPRSAGVQLTWQF